MIPSFKFVAYKFEFDSNGYTEATRRAVTAAVRLAARAFLLEADSLIPVDTGFLRGAFGTLEDAMGSVSQGTVVPPSNPAVRKAKLNRKIAAILDRQGKIKPRWQRRQEALASAPKGKKMDAAKKILAQQDREISKDKERLAKFNEHLAKVAHARDLETHQNRTDTKQGQYYYPTPPGRSGRKKGVIRGGILKTPTSGRPFATPVGEILVSEGSNWTFTYEVDISYYAPNDTRYGWNSWRSATEAFLQALENEFANLPNIMDFVTTVTGSAPSVGTVSDDAFGVDGE